MRKFRISKTAIHTYFNDVNCEEKAYLLGFILADGCIEQGYGVNSISLRNSIDDLETGKLYQKEIFPGNTLSIRKHLNKKDIFSIKGSSKEIIKDLNSFNIGPRKTFDFKFTFPFEKLPKDLIRHFIRGFFDGDGTFTSFRFEFITTSKPFMYQIIELITNEFGCEVSIREKQTKNVIEYMFYFHIGSKNSHSTCKPVFIGQLYNWFYKDSKCFLTRKKEKFEMYLNTVLNRWYNDHLSV